MRVDLSHLTKDEKRLRHNKLCKERVAQKKLTRLTYFDIYWLAHPWRKMTEAEEKWQLKRAAIKPVIQKLK